MSQWIDALTACRVLLGDPTKEELQSISYDSRKAKAGDLFLCLKGTGADCFRRSNFCSGKRTGRIAFSGCGAR